MLNMHSLIKSLVLMTPTLLLIWFLQLSGVQVMVFLAWYFLHDFLNDIFHKIETNKP